MSESVVVTLLLQSWLVPFVAVRVCVCVELIRIR